MIFTNFEKEIIEDTKFLSAKIKVIEKVQLQFEIVRQNLFDTCVNSKFKFPINMDTKIGKIFKGENYQNLPYVVLDYPKLFNKESIFTFRTMFWWGNFFSFTLHLQGNAFQDLRENIIKSKDNLISKDLYICLNDSPWEYHYGEDNYIKLNDINFNLIENHHFLKLSSKFLLSDIDILPESADRYLDFYLEILK